MFNLYYYLIISFILIFFTFDKIVDYLNTLNWSNKIPEELNWIYDEEKYFKSQNYEKDKYKFNNIKSIFEFLLLLIFFIFWWFWHLDTIIRNNLENKLLISLVFFLLLFFIQFIFSIPFAYYFNFVIEEKFWFNKMNKKLFFIDTLKSFLISIIIWWWILTLLIWIYQILWINFWIIWWIIITSFSLFMLLFYSTLIVPLFNKQEKLKDSELKTSIINLSKKLWFKINNIYIIDWSKRSSKANAYFTWFWNKKRIVLYDTLIKDLTNEELLAVLSHEIWHYKKKHTLQMFLFSIIQTWLILFLLSYFLWSKDIASALNSNETSFHIWLIGFFILFTPLNLILSIITNIISRKNEYQADNYTKENWFWENLINALKKLSKNNLSNLNPHKIYEFIHYSHPSVLKRINNLK